jgi:hypothetical protein
MQYSEARAEACSFETKASAAGDLLKASEEERRIEVAELTARAEGLVQQGQERQSELSLQLVEAQAEVRMMEVE